MRVRNCKSKIFFYYQNFERRRNGNCAFLSFLCFFLQTYRSCQAACLGYCFDADHCGVNQVRFASPSGAYPCDRRWCKRFGPSSSRRSVHRAKRRIGGGRSCCWLACCKRRSFPRWCVTGRGVAKQRWVTCRRPVVNLGIHIDAQSAASRYTILHSFAENLTFQFVDGLRTDMFFPGVFHFHALWQSSACWEKFFSLRARATDF